jgi:hypothetical protein
MPLVLAIEAKVEEGEPYGCLRREGLRQRREITLWRGRVNATVIKSVKRLDRQLSNCIYSVGQLAPESFCEACAEPKLLIASGFHDILGKLKLCVIPAKTKSVEVV